MTSVSTVTGRVWPIRCARFLACASRSGSQQGSRKMIRLAAVSVKPCARAWTRLKEHVQARTHARAETDIDDEDALVRIRREGLEVLLAFFDVDTLGDQQEVGQA